MRVVAALVAGSAVSCVVWAMEKRLVGPAGMLKMRMDNMKSWLEAEKHFREISEPLSALWLQFQGGVITSFELGGAIEPSKKIDQFKARSIIAGQSLALCLNDTTREGRLILAEESPLYRWYRALQVFCGSQLENQTVFKDGETGEILGNTAVLHEVVEVSANLCLFLHASYPLPEEGSTVSPITIINTNGGAYIEGVVNTGGGAFNGRDVHLPPNREQSVPAAPEPLFSPIRSSNSGRLGIDLAWEIERHSLYGPPENPREFDAFLLLGIRNNGSTTAKFPEIILIEDEDLKLSEYGVDGNGNTGLPLVRTTVKGPSRRSRRSRRFKGDGNYVIHPGTELYVTRVEYKLSFHLDNWPKHQIVEYKIFCEGDHKEGRVEIPLTEGFRHIKEFWLSTLRS